MRVLKVKVISLPYIFQVLYVLCFTRSRYQVSVFRTNGPLVCYCYKTIPCLYIHYYISLLDSFFFSRHKSENLQHLKLLPVWLEITRCSSISRNSTGYSSISILLNTVAVVIYLQYKLINRPQKKYCNCCNNYIGKLL